MQPLDCEACLKKGHRCPATHTTADGKPTCVFCLDGEPCPVIKRQPPAPALPARRNRKMTTKVVTPTARRCKAPVNRQDPDSPPCGTVLRPSNQSGYCRVHSHFAKMTHPPVAKDAFPEAPSPRVNGNHHPSPVKPSNGHKDPIQVSVTEDMVTNLFLRIPVQDRASLVFGWLAGGQA